MNNCSGGLLVLVLFVCLLLSLLFLRSILIPLVALLKLSTHLCGSGVIADLHPGVRNNVRDGEALVRVEAQHCSDKVLEVLVEEPFFLALGVG